MDPDIPFDLSDLADSVGGADDRGAGDERAVDPARPPEPPVVDGLDNLFGDGRFDDLRGLPPDVPVAGGPSDPTASRPPSSIGAGDGPGAPGAQPPPGPRPDPQQSGPLPADEPVDLRLDGPATVPDLGSGGAPVEIDLSLDDADVLGPDSLEAPTSPTGITLPSDGGEPFEVSFGNSWLMPGLIAAGAVAIGVAVPAVLRTHRSTPRDFAAHLDELGIDARVEHLDLTGLQEMIEDGRSVLLSTDGTAGTDTAAVLQLRSVDRAAGRLLVADAENRNYTIDVARFETAWSDSANEVVVAAGDTRSVALVPVTLDARDLVAAR